MQPEGYVRYGRAMSISVWITHSINVHDIFANLRVANGQQLRHSLDLALASPIYSKWRARVDVNAARNKFKANNMESPNFLFEHVMKTCGTSKCSTCHHILWCSTNGYKRTQTRERSKKIPRQRRPMSEWQLGSEEEIVSKS